MLDPYIGCHGLPTPLHCTAKYGVKRKRAALLVSSCSPMPTPYTKTHRTPAGHVADLMSKGLHVSDRVRAERAIEEIGYYRLRIYFLSRRQINVIGRPFEPGISFEDIIKIYEFDENLRIICFRYCARIEIIFRNIISEVLSSRFGAHPYFDSSIYRSPEAQMNALQNSLRVYLVKKDNDPRAKHYFNTYNPPVLPPIWTLKDLWTFGQANVFYETLEPILANDIARIFGVPDRTYLSSWVKVLIDLRNICGHHDRLFNRNFQKSPKRVNNLSIPSKIPPNKLHSIIEVAQHIIRIFDPAYDCITPIAQLIAKTPQIRSSEMGF